MGKQAGGPVTRAPVNMFRIEVEGQNIFASTCGELKNTFTFIETFEGGNRTLIDQTVSMFRAEPVQITRPLTKDRTIEDWSAAQKRGEDDKRDCAFIALDALGNDLYRWDLEQCVVGDHSFAKGDAKDGENQQMEVFTLKPTVVGDRQDLQ